MSKYRGLTMCEARERLASVAERCVADQDVVTHIPSLSMMWRQELLHSKMDLCAGGAIMVLLFGYGFDTEFKATTLAMALLVLCSLVVNITIKSIYQRCEALELRDRVSSTCKAYVHNSRAAMGQPAEYTGHPQSQRSKGQAVGLLQGSALATVIPVYRSGLWQRIPKLLLVEGDVIALMGGDKAPANAELLHVDTDAASGGKIASHEQPMNAAAGHHFEDSTSVLQEAKSLAQDCAVEREGNRVEESHANAAPQSLFFEAMGSQVSAGQHIELRSEATEYFKTKTMVSATSPSLLFLCGDMRCYRLLSTPLAAHLQHSLSPESRRPQASLLRKRIKEARAMSVYVLLCMVTLAVAAGGIRMALSEGSRGSWMVFLMVIPCQVAICLLPISLPFYLAIGEAVVTARLLAFCELTLLRKSAEKHDVSRRGGSSESNPSHPRGDSDEVLATGEAPFGYDIFDQFDAEEREEVISGATHRISWGRARTYFSEVMRTRWECGTQLTSTQEHIPAVDPGPCSGCSSQDQNDVGLGPGQASVSSSRHLSVASRAKSTGLFTGLRHASNWRSKSRPVGDIQQGPSCCHAGQRLLVVGTNQDRTPEWGEAHAQGCKRSGFDVETTCIDGRTDVSGSEYGLHSLPKKTGLFGEWPLSLPPKRTTHPATAAVKNVKDPGVAEGGGIAGDNCGFFTEQVHGHGPMTSLGPFRMLLPVPLLGCGLVERLGAVTNLCMLDEDTVCQSTSSIEEVFLLDDSKDEDSRGSGTVLDMHKQQGHSGVRFEDPQWWTHMAALKPIGLTCLLSETSTALSRPQVPRQQGRVKAVQSPISETTPPLSTRHQKHRRRPDRALLDHVRDSRPMEHLTELWRGIGFCEGDRSSFREKRRIHVINPKLAADRVTADTHAQGQEESWRRGTIQPHVASVVVQDKRTSSLQLLSQGHPKIVVAMCRDYWDGSRSTISTLPEALQKGILDMHQQWSLEDLDVTSFAYTPVPYTLNPFLSPFNKHPDYLVYSNHGPGKGRSRGGPISSESPRAEGVEKGSEEGHLAAITSSASTRGGAKKQLQGRPFVHGRGGESMEEHVATGSTGAIEASTLDQDHRPAGCSMTRSHSTQSDYGSWTPEKKMQGSPAHGNDTETVNPSAGQESLHPQPEKTEIKLPPSSIAQRQEYPTDLPHAHLNTRPWSGRHHDIPPQRALKGEVSLPGNNVRSASSDALRPLSPSLKKKMLREVEVLSKVGTDLHSQPKERPLGDGGRRYSMDDYGVNMAHQAELINAKGSAMGAGGGNNMTEALWSLMHEQVFLGMAASSVPPKREMVPLIEDLCAAGVRFVYFSPRNMRRSKALAENMGIETDWNCAISLRPLKDSTQPDPHRMTSAYADWDVKARLPHGVAAIREHIECVDNVPLLVSLFTDATPETTKEMLGIYSEHLESVLAVGMSYRAMNAELFRTADLSLSIEGLPLNQPLSSLPVASPGRFSAIDAAFNSEIVGLHAALPLGELVRIGGAMSGLDEVGSVLIGLIREGRRLLDNIYQALSFMCMVSFTVALLIVLGAALPVSHPLMLGGDHILWVLWIVAPLLAMSFLVSGAEAGLMRRTPEKNDPKVVPITRRLLAHLCIRAAPTALICVGLYLVIFGQLLVQADTEATCEGQGLGAQWLDSLWCSDLESTRSDPVVTQVKDQAVDLAVAELVLCLLAQSPGLMYRTATVLEGKPWKNRAWYYIVILIICIQNLYIWASAAARGTTSILLSCPWEPLVVGAVCPLVVAAVGCLVKQNDARAYKRYITLLRLEFDTRLGMHSPR